MEWILYLVMYMGIGVVSGMVFIGMLMGREWDVYYENELRKFIFLWPLMWLVMAWILMFTISVVCFDRIMDYMDRMVDRN
jgi:hypothetical protein